MPLNELKIAFDTQRIEELEKFLQEHIHYLNEEEKRLKQIRSNVNWLIDFYGYAKKLNGKRDIYFRSMEDRAVVFTNCERNEHVYYLDMQFRRILAQEELRDCKITTLYGYILNYESLMQNDFCPEKATIFVELPPDCQSENVIRIPKAEFLCYQVKLLDDKPDFTKIINYLGGIKRRPKLILANEYQIKLHDLRSSPFELQILF